MNNHDADCPIEIQWQGDWITAKKQGRWEFVSRAHGIRAAVILAMIDGDVLLVDQGTADQFLEEQLKPELLREACEKADIPLTLNMRAGYDHSYYFISSFMADHVAWHARRLKA